MGKGWGEGEIRNPLSLPNPAHVAVPSPILFILSIQCKKSSPIMGEGWGEGENPQPPVMAKSAAAHGEPGTRGNPLPSPILFILSIDVKRQSPSPYHGSGLG